MSDITVLSRTQRIIVNPVNGAVSVVNAGPQGPPGLAENLTELEDRVTETEADNTTQDGAISTLQSRVTVTENDNATQDTAIEDLQDLWALNGISHITGPVVQHAGPVFTNHDNYKWYPKEFEGNATYVPNGATIHAPAYWSFADNATQWIKWLWQPGDAWEAYTIKLGVLLPGFVASNPSRWRYSEDRFVVNQPSSGGGNTAQTPSAVASVTVPAIEALGTGNFYGDIATNVPWSNPFELVLSTIERLPLDAADTQAGALGLYIVTATRTDI